MLKRFMFAAIGLLALAAAINLGASTARGGTGSIVAMGNGVLDNYELLFAVTDNGDVYAKDRTGTQWSYISNVFGGVSTQPTTWGQIKHRAGQ